MPKMYLIMQHFRSTIDYISILNQNMIAYDRVDEYGFFIARPSAHFDILTIQKFG